MFERVLVLVLEEVIVLVVLVVNAWESGVLESVVEWVNCVLVVEEVELVLDVLCEVYCALGEIDCLSDVICWFVKCFRDCGDEMVVCSIL